MTDTTVAPPHLYVLRTDIEPVPLPDGGVLLPGRAYKLSDDLEATLTQLDVTGKIKWLVQWSERSAG